jgi:hypothetical protein
MINDSQEAALSNATRPKQDKNIPFLINVDDGRLVPNMPRLRLHPKYRPYHGVLTASQADRMTYLKTEYKNMPRSVIDSTKTKSFDIGTASREELIAFALSEYGTSLAPTLNAMSMRVQLRKLAEDAGQLKADHSLV